MVTIGGKSDAGDMQRDQEQHQVGQGLVHFLERASAPRAVSPPSAEAGPAVCRAGSTAWLDGSAMSRSRRLLTS
jgi:hypothetical protein